MHDVDSWIQIFEVTVMKRDWLTVSKSFCSACLCGVFAFGFAANAFGAGAKTWKIGILRADAPYAVAIETALLKELKNVSHGQLEFLPTAVVPSQVTDAAETAKLLNALLDKKPDIIATIGTQASAPVWPIIREKKIPMVFSGVTYPVEAKLIEAFNKPTGNGITGIGYAIPAKRRIEVIRSMFPDTRRFQKIAFVYSSQVQQEHSYVKSLKALGTHEQWQYSFIDFFDPAQSADSSKMLLSKVNEIKPDLVLGWFSLDKLGNNEADIKALLEQSRQPMLVLTSKFVDMGAIGGVITDHQDLGYQQALMISKIMRGEKAGNIAPLEPTKFLIELNLKKAKEFDITFPPKVVESAAKLVK